MNCRSWRWQTGVLRPWRDQADGTLSYAAVTHGGLWPPVPSLCRYAERPIDLIQLEVRDVQALSTTHPGLTRAPTDVPEQLP